MKKETSMHDKNCIKVSHIPTGSGIFSVLTPQATLSRRLLPFTELLYVNFFQTSRTNCGKKADDEVKAEETEVSEEKTEE